MKGGSRRAVQMPKADTAATATVKRVARPRSSARALVRLRAEVEVMRHGAPIEVERHLEVLQRNGAIEPVEPAATADAELDARDSGEAESVGGDEDGLEPDLAFPDFLRGGGGSGSMRRDGPGSTRRSAFELVVTTVDGAPQCLLAVPDWVGGYRGRSSTGKQCLRALDERLTTLRCLALWLTGRKAAFLASRELWDLGPSDRSQFKPATVLQKNLLAVLKRDYGVRVGADTFSRHVSACDLIWEGAGAPLAEVLFSRAAALAWVARVAWVANQEKPLTDAMLAPAIVRGKKTSGARAGLKAKNASDWHGEVTRACTEVKVAWADVVVAHRIGLCSPSGTAERESVSARVRRYEDG